MITIGIKIDESVIDLKLLNEWGWTRELVREEEFYQNTCVGENWAYKYQKGHLKNMTNKQAFETELSERLLKLL